MSTKFEDLILRDTTANKPAAGIPGRLFYDTTLNQLERDNGTTWDEIEGIAASTTPAMVLIDEKILAAAAANFDFISIPGTYNHLKVMVMGRSDKAGAFSVDVHVRFNNDSGNNYDVQLLNTAGTNTPESSNVMGGAGNYIGVFPGATAHANKAGTMWIDIFDYALTTFHKSFQSGSGGNYSTSTAAENLGRYGFGSWRNTAAITRVTVLVDSSNFIAGSVARLYGIT